MPPKYLILGLLIPKCTNMKNSSLLSSGNFYKCPYQTKVYGIDKSELIYRKPYQGNLDDWDDLPGNITPKEKDANLQEKGQRSVFVNILQPNSSLIV